MDVDESSSSDSDEDSKLKEALDPHMFNNEIATKKKEPEESIKKVPCYKDNVLNVTPEFQSYVAKHLSDMLNKTIEEYEGKDTNIERDHSGGIQLFKSSQDVLTTENFCESSRIEGSGKNKRKRRIHESEATLLAKARSVAVSPEWVLEKQGIRGWCQPKGKEIKTKLNAVGELEIVESSFVCE